MGARAQCRGRRLGGERRRRAGSLHARLRIDGPNRRAHGADVVGRRPAAAAHNLRSGGNGLAREAGHILRRAQVDVAPLDGPRHAGVGHGGQRQRGGPAHGLDGGQHRSRAGGAVHPDRSRAPFRQQRRGLSGRRAVQAVALVVHRHHHQYRQIGRRLSGSFQRLVCLIQRGHGLDNQKVDAGCSQGVNLLGEGRPGFVQAGLAQRLQTHSQRAHRSGYPGLAGMLFLQMLHRLAGQPHSGGIDFRHFAAQTMPGQPESIGPKGVGFKNFSPRLQVFLMDGQDQAGVGEVQFVVAAVDEDAAPVDHGTHGPVGEHRPVSEDVGELRHSLVMLSHYRGGCIPKPQQSSRRDHQGAATLFGTEKGHSIPGNAVSYHAPTRQRYGLLCYTSGVISWAGYGYGRRFFLCPINLQPPSFRSRRGRGDHTRFDQRISSR